MKYPILFYLLFFFINTTKAQTNNGYDLWLNYKLIDKTPLLSTYKTYFKSVYLNEASATKKAAKKELSRGLKGLLGSAPIITPTYNNETSVVIAKKKYLPLPYSNGLEDSFNAINTEGFIIKAIELNNKKKLIITAHTDIGLLYGVFRLLRELQEHHTLDNLTIIDAPKTDLRILNHWDNLDRSVERGFAGFSLWNWQKLPEYIDERYIDYARANASIGINGTVLNNVNSNALILTPMYLQKVKALADAFRPYGIKVYLTARFSAPIEIDGLKSADPLDIYVKDWWQTKTEEIYRLIPDFGGFLVKANSEGQPGPQNYGRTHVDGANMLAKALKPYNGVVMWRAFVYSEQDPTDRAKQAYNEFVPFDGQFEDNVLIQSKNGAIDFQPREPFHPMFGAMPKTNLMMEFQITQEYLGFSTHLVFLPKLYEEVLESDTHQKDKGASVANVIDGSLHPKKLTGIAGVANIGNDINWTGHPFAQANWYGFGRLAWNPNLKAEAIATEWLNITYSTNPKFTAPVKQMMLQSREAVVNYMMPLGLHHLFDTGHHYGPGPWVSNLSRPEWNPVYYHKADENGIGFDRTPTGSNATEQYAQALTTKFNDVNQCPEDYLLWFHHLPWDHQLKNGKTLWDNLALKYQDGVNQVNTMITTWQGVKPYISEKEHHDVEMLLAIQLKEAKWWRDACLLYFQTFSKKELPNGVDKPKRTLDYYKSLKFPFAPGIKPQWD